MKKMILSAALLLSMPLLVRAKAVTVNQTTNNLRALLARYEKELAELNQDLLKVQADIADLKINQDNNGAEAGDQDIPQTFTEQLQVLRDRVDFIEAVMEERKAIIISMREEIYQLQIGAQKEQEDRTAALLEIQAVLEERKVTILNIKAALFALEQQAENHEQRIKVLEEAVLKKNISSEQLALYDNHKIA